MTAEALDVLRELAEQHKGRADDCGALARAVNNALPHLLSRIQELERERDKIIKTLGCHPAYLLPELMQVMSRADDKPNIDDYRQLQQRAEAAESRALAAEKDAARMDWLQSVKTAHFSALNDRTDISAVGLFTIPSQHVTGNTVRDAIDTALKAIGERGR
jgi:hypothetical protein